MSVSCAEWDKEYADGRWDYLREADEAGRYGLIASLLRHYVPEGRILDVGCGEGILLDYLHPRQAGNYTGIEFSGAAREKLLSRFPSVEVAGVTAEDFAPVSEERFAAIVFNEVLYYLNQPIYQLERYARFLSPGGAIVVSMFQPPKGSPWRHIVRRLSEGIADAGCFKVVQHIVLRSIQVDRTWRLMLLNVEGA